MNDEITILIPVIEEAYIAPTPANINTPVVVRAKVSEQEVVLYPEPVYCGDFYCGEV